MYSKNYYVVSIKIKYCQTEENVCYSYNQGKNFLEFQQVNYSLLFLLGTYTFVRMYFYEKKTS